MPRDVGTGIYHYPDGTPGNPGQTIFSTRYNTFINDLTNTLNQALPVNMGGTGGTSAATARDNLDAEVSGVQVTDYDAHVFESGSFWSAPGATTPPVGGIYIMGTSNVTGNNTFLEARILGYTPEPSPVYVRQRLNGVWGTWKLDGRTTAGAAEGISGATADMFFGVTGTAPASAFMVNSKADVTGTPLFVVNKAGPTTLFNTLTVGNAGTTGAVYFGNTGLKNLTYDGTNFSFSGGSLYVTAGDVSAGGNVFASQPSGGNLAGTFHFGTANGGTKFLNYNGSSLFTFSGGNLIIRNAAAALTLNANSGVPVLNFSIADTVQSFINDNGTSININSNATGSVGMYMAHGGSSWVAFSDARLPYKKTAKPMTVLDKIDKVDLYENIVNGRPEFFVKAQELVHAFPHLVYVGSGPDSLVDSYEPTGMSDPAMWGVSYERAGVAALQGLKEMKALVVDLMARIEALEAAQAPP